MKTSENTHQPETKQLESEGSSFMAPPEFSLSASGDAPADGGGDPNVMRPSREDMRPGGKGGPETMNFTLSEGAFSTPTQVAGMVVLGRESFNADSVGHVVRYVLAGTAEQWSKILQYTDDDMVFLTYVSGFLKASTDPEWIKYGNNNATRSNHHIQVQRAPNDADKLEFLKALYGVDVAGGNGDLDFVNTMAEEGPLGSAIGDPTSGQLANFIKQYQGLLIRYISDKEKDSLLDVGQPETLADQATRFSEKPQVVHAMIQNAFATAVATAKVVLARATNQHDKTTAIEAIDTEDMVRNSAIIIKGAIAAYGENVSNLGDGAGSVFDQAWGLIPIPDIPGLGLIVDYAKDAIKPRFTSFATGLKSPSSWAEDFANEYHSILKGSVAQIVAELGDQIDDDKLVAKFNVLTHEFRLFLL